MTLRMRENETETDIVLIRKEHRRILRNLKAIPGEFQDELVVADIGKKKDKLVERCEDQEAI